MPEGAAEPRARYLDTLKLQFAGEEKRWGHDPSRLNAIHKGYRLALGVVHRLLSEGADPEELTESIKQYRKEE